MIVKNANVYDPKTETFSCRSLYIHQGIILDDQLSLESINPSHEIVDLTGKYFYPSFFDSHCHLVGTGKIMNSIRLDHIQNKHDLVKLLNDHHLQITFRGWDENLLSFFPDRSFLDEIVSDRSLLLVRKCGHVGTVNSHFIKEYDIGTLEGLDGSILKTGLLQERALFEATKKIPFHQDQEIKMFENSSEVFLKKGVTAVHSEDWNVRTFPKMSPYLSQQKLIRLFETICISNKNDLLEWVLIRNKTKTSSFLNISSIKLYLDGSLGAKTAFLKKPYHNDNQRGILYYSVEELSEIIAIAERESISITIHVIGDAALDVALSAFSKSIHTGNPLRHKLIHVQLASDEQLQRILDLNLYVAIQPSFLTSDQLIAPLLLGEKRSKEIGYPFQKMHSLGINLSFSTDSPIEALSPFTTLASSDLWIDRKKAFYYYSEKSAESVFQENKLGCLTKKAYADGFVLSKNLFTIPFTSISNVIPELVMFHGDWFKGES